MHLLLAPLALSFLQAAGGAPTAATELPDLTLEQSSSLRCSVAFGLVHRAQSRGEEAAAAYKEAVINLRGEEFLQNNTQSLC